MASTADTVRATLKAGWETLRSQTVAARSATEEATPAILPIRSLGHNQRIRVAKHLLSLSASDRYLRFGYSIQDEQIRMYVASLDFERDNIFGIFDRKLALLGVAHLAYGDLRRRGGCAEFGVSVVSKSRGRRYGTRMFERAAMHARNMGVRTLFIHALSENVAMLKIARAAGARVHRDGAECEAYLKLPAPTLNSRLTEFLNAKIAEGDYHLKRHAKQLRRTVADWNSVQPSVGEEAKNKPM